MPYLTDDDVKQYVKEYEASVERVQLRIERAGLTKRKRDIFTLRRKEQTQEQIAKKLKISQPAVAKALERLLKKFKTVGLERPCPPQIFHSLCKLS
jgi:DNA-binding CsgD family transcriptional regulator